MRCGVLASGRFQDAALLCLARALGEAAVLRPAGRWACPALRKAFPAGSPPSDSVLLTGLGWAAVSSFILLGGVWSSFFSGFLTDSENLIVTS